MDDRQLLNHYLEIHGPEAAPWNLSPRNLYAEYRMRQFFLDHQPIRNSMAVCNVGIGAGYWDTFITYWLGNNGSLTSIDIDPQICELYNYRQKRENNPNPAKIVCGDVRNKPLADRSFDLVTVIGVEPTVPSEFSSFLDGAYALLNHAGMLFYWENTRRHLRSEFENYTKQTGRIVECLEEDDHFPTFSFYMAFTR